MEAWKKELEGLLGAVSVFAYDEIDSTNTEAKRLLAGGRIELPALVVAECQSGGRGRQGRSFYSPRGAGVYMSVVTGAAGGGVLSMTTMAAVAVVRAIEALTDKKPRIKWVNDVYLDGKKICGILAEAVLRPGSNSLQAVVTGIGVNLWLTELPEELAETVTALNTPDLSRNQLIARITKEFLALTADLTDHSYLKEYREHSLILGKEINCHINGEIRRATAVDIDEAGGLVIRHPDGSTETLRSGEVTIRLA